MAEPVPDVSWREFGPGTACIVCRGTVNNEISGAIETVWQALQRKSVSRLLLDLSPASNIYSCGLGVIIKLHKETAARGGAMVVVSPRGYVRTVLSAAKLVKLLRLADTAREGLTMLNAHSPPAPPAAGPPREEAEESPDGIPAHIVKNAIEGVTYYYYEG